jgi:pilus assembly protein FimV
LNRLLHLALVTLVAAPAAVTAQNLGRLGLLSGLGEPLDAEIEITAPPEKRASLSADIVPFGVYERFGVAPSPRPEVLRAAVERTADGRQIVRLRSTVPLDRPAVEVIVELAWNGGRMVRQYSFTLDASATPVAKGEPPAARTPEPAPAAPTAEPAPAAPTAEPVPAAPTAEPVPAAPTPKPVPAVATATAPATKAPAAAKAVTKPKSTAQTERSKTPAAAGRPGKDRATPSDSDIAAAESRVKDLERTMSDLQEKIDARNREIEALQRQVGGSAAK